MLAVLPVRPVLFAVCFVLVLDCSFVILFIRANIFEVTNCGHRADVSLVLLLLSQ